MNKIKDYLSWTWSQINRFGKWCGSLLGVFTKHQALTYMFLSAIYICIGLFGFDSSSTTLKLIWVSLGLGYFALACSVQKWDDELVELDKATEKAITEVYRGFFEETVKRYENPVQKVQIHKQDYPNN